MKEATDYAVETTVSNCRRLVCLGQVRGFCIPVGGGSKPVLTLPSTPAVDFDFVVEKTKSKWPVGT